MKIFSQQVLVVYSAVLSTIFAVMMLTGAKFAQTKAFDEIQVHRINIVEPDGTLRMVISNRDRLPGVIVKGKESNPSTGLKRAWFFTTMKDQKMGGSSLAVIRTKKVR